MDAICTVGSAPDASVIALSQAALVAWAETMVRGDPLHIAGSSGGSGSGISSSGSGSGIGRRRSSVPSSSSSQSGRGAAASAGEQQVAPRLRMGVDSDGAIVAGLASWDAASRLFASSQQARELLSEGARKGHVGVAAGEGGEQLEFTVRLKNFQLLFGGPAP